MFSECDEIAENIFSVLSESTIEHLKFNRERIRTLVKEQMQDESDTVISNVTESLTTLIRNHEAKQ